MTNLPCSVPACIRLVDLDSIALGIVRLSMGAVGMAVVMAWQRRTTPYGR